MKKWMLIALAIALLVLSAVSQGCNRLEKWTVTITVDGQGTTDPAGASSWWDSGETMMVTATPAAFWRFDQWGGDLSGTQNPLIFEIEKNMTLVAHFIPYTQSQNLTNDTMAMAPGERDADAVGFYVEAGTMHDVIVSGTFAVTSTSPGDQVEVLILDDANTSALFTGGSWTALYSSGPTTAGTLNVPITSANEEATRFYLVFVGTSPSGPSVQVNANVDLNWTQRS